MIKRYCDYCKENIENNKILITITDKAIRKVKMDLYGLTSSTEELKISGIICDKCYYKLIKVLNKELRNILRGRDKA